MARPTDGTRTNCYAVLDAAFSSDSASVNARIDAFEEETSLRIGAIVVI